MKVYNINQNLLNALKSFRLLSLLDDDIPLSDEILHGEVHLLVVLGLNLQLLYINLLKQVIDVNLLNRAGDLSLEIGILLLKL